MDDNTRPSAPARRTRLRGVVVGWDGSDHADAALDWAAAWADSTGTPLTIVMASPTHIRGHVMPDTAADQERVTAREEALRGVGDRIHAQYPQLPLETRHERRAPRLALLEQTSPDAVLVVAAHGENPWNDHEPLGSTTAALLTHSRGPVLIHPGTLGTPGAGPVVVGVDDTTVSRDAIRFAADLAKDLGSDLLALHARGWDGGPEAMADLRRSVNEVLSPEDHDPGVTPQVIMQTSAQPPESLLVDRSETATALVVGRRGTGGFQELLLGTTSRRVAEYAHGIRVIVPAYGG